MSQRTLIAEESTADRTVFAILVALSFCHFLNDMMQSLLAAIYPMLKKDYALSFGQIGILTMAFQLTASILQPLVGLYTDKRPLPYALFAGMSSTLLGLLLLSVATAYLSLLVGAALIGFGSAIFHPDASRVARMASGGRHGLAQSLFQVGGNFGAAFGPLIAAFIVLPRGQSSLGWFTFAALLAMVILWQVGGWYKCNYVTTKARLAKTNSTALSVTSKQVIVTLCILGILIFSKFVYTVSLSSYYTFYVMHKFHISVQDAQIHLFIFLASVATGTLIGGSISDRFGRKWVIWVSILGVLPFTLALPYANLDWTIVLIILIGLILASAFSSIIVYGQELIPGRIGMVSGMFFGFAFGISGLSAAGLGELADLKGIDFVFSICSYLPALGLLAAFLPNTDELRAKTNPSPA
ncbi:fosmidomycin resistance protein [Candidatus Nitrosoglobus terrae]|uniref:Fosmidomycin resistance protein n=1 Tax=Candidatus Nitrosoglobus terrae TaxID=1630141 RepID=A0A1Q2SP55_9GAMM|nr:MFS transporter [Candidatus Nitrosoglobus terrae]BAW80883.1 fosmidomycin resistance protein [Candidatus Nitrosoglobus terrae]